VKGIEVLFEAYGRLDHPPPLVLLGTLESDTPEDIPAGAIALGAASYGTVIEAWDRCLFGVMPSLWPEPFGSVVHEAMARGKAVIGTFPGGHSDMIEHGESGLLVRSGDVKALTAAMETLVTDATVRESLGRAAAAQSRGFTAEAVIPRFTQLYDDISVGNGHA
jgi:glycosyltransferase involved in cell wall biosynthesis